MIKLELLPPGFTVEEFTDGWEICSEDAPLMAFISKEGGIEYYRTDSRYSIYGSVDINMERLLELKKACEDMVK